jgi:CRISPR-associated protein Cmr1
MEFYIERYKNRERLDFECEVITPMFISGSNTKEVDLRSASIKGALRFWWRALYGSRFSSIADMKKEEGNLFGDTEKKSKIRLYVDISTQFIISNDNLVNGRTFLVHGHPLSIFDYLAFGLCEYDRNQHRNVYKRKHIKPSSKFIIHFDFNNINNNSEQILKALSCLNSLGGLGAKSRNGFGCISIKPLNSNISLPQITNFSGERKEFTALNNDCKLFTFQPQNRWEEALSDIGLAYRTARLSIEPRHSYQNRPLLAKPLIVRNENISINDRHSKPYFLHVSKLANNQYQGSILYIPYNYYQNDKLEEYNNVCNKVNQELERLRKQGGR